ncbi:hypothetical protein ON010_g1961 [Phytophthora cinnamomi]|nr:hypothetical protein ON010_g1961 [Phytophthora cinnamomi]
MRVCQAILVAAVVSSANTASLSVEEAGWTRMDLAPPPQLANALKGISSGKSGQGRSLRVDAAIHANEEEERGWDFKSIVRKIVSHKEGKVQQPILSILKETPEDVLKIEALQHLPRNVRKSHKNYRRVIRVDADVLKEWLKDRVTSFSAWKKLGLLKVREDQLDEVMDTKKIADYMTYMKILDDTEVAKWKKTGMAPLVSLQPTAAELTSRAIALGVYKRDDEYAKLVLGLGGIPENALKGHTNYRFYEDFKLALKGPER